MDHDLTDFHSTIFLRLCTYNGKSYQHNNLHLYCFRVDELTRRQSGALPRKMGLTATNKNMRHPNPRPDISKSKA